MADLGDGRVLQRLAQGFEHGRLVEVAGGVGRADGDVEALAGLDADAHAGELGEHRADVGGLGVDGDHRGGAHAGDERG